MNLPDWEEVSAALRESGAPATAAECHGALCGLLCAGSGEPAVTWLHHTLGEGATVPPPPLDRLFAETRRQVDDAVFDFELLLPDDERPLAERTTALAAWCEGFAFGVGVGASNHRDHAMPNDSAEFLRDITEIARAGIDGDSAEEAAYAEVCEYIRVGVLLMRTECLAEAAAAAARSPIPGDH